MNESAKNTEDRAPIEKFQGRYAFLSNFYPSPVRLDGEDYPSAEHAFQAAKTEDPDERRAIREADLPSRAKKLGRRATLSGVRAGAPWRGLAKWETIKVEVMLDVLRSKFSNPTLREKLLDTGDRHLIEGNTWGDQEWGVSGGRGKNLLGQALMIVRREIRERQGDDTSAEG